MSKPVYEGLPTPSQRPSFEQREHRANVMRLRTAVALGGSIWLVFVGIDWIFQEDLYRESIAPTLLIRLAGTPFHLGFLWWLSRRPLPGRRALLFLDSAMFGLTSALLAGVVIAVGGIGVPYPSGVFLVLIGRNAFLVQSWKQGLLPNASVVLAHFGVLLVAEWLYPGLVFTAKGGGSAALLFIHFSVLSSAAVMLSVASHSTWTLRRRVYAARILGRYRLSERVAEGGHGEVWKAYDLRLKRDVAIKVLRTDLAEDDHAIARFEREIDALCQLQHPNTIRILDYGVTGDGVGYYVMELLEGRTMSELVDAEGPIDPARVVSLVLQAARALDEAHQHDLVHRDIKPENIFVCSSIASRDFVKVLDFGIAKRHVSDPLRLNSLTQTGMVIGTPAFMAPEVARGKLADFRADVFSLGAVAYFLLVGTPPYGESPPEGPEPMRPATPLRLACSDAMPTDLEHVVMRCLSVEPSKRYKDAGELAAVLASLHVSSMARRARGTGSGVTTEPTRTTQRRRD